MKGETMNDDQLAALRRRHDRMMEQERREHAGEEVRPVGFLRFAPDVRSSLMRANAECLRILASIPKVAAAPPLVRLA